MDSEKRKFFNDITKTLLEGLVTDGAHHKQYALEKILRIICEDAWVDKVKDEFKWEDGFPG